MKTIKLDLKKMAESYQKEVKEKSDRLLFDEFDQASPEILQERFNLNCVDSLRLSSFLNCLDFV